jgi:hypothetical protein
VVLESSLPIRSYLIFSSGSHFPEFRVIFFDVANEVFEVNRFYKLINCNTTTVLTLLSRKRGAVIIIS